VDPPVAASSDESVPSASVEASSSEDDSSEYVRGPASSANDRSTFQHALQAVAKGQIDVRDALEDLTELAHDVQYGQEIVRNHAALEKLICWMSGAESNTPLDQREFRIHHAAATISAALQNNPTALEELPWMKVAHPRCGNHEETDLVRLLKGPSQLTSKSDIDKAVIIAINGFLKHKELRDDLLKQDIMGFLLQASLESSTDVQQRIAQLVTDNFIDEEMGAERGVWPTESAMLDEICATNRYEGGCWEFQWQIIAKASKASWAADFARALEKERGRNVKALPGKEL
jgi:nucleotide exchange factor SIL1